MSKCLVTGAAGFIGSNFVRQLLHEEPEMFVVGYDALTYAGNIENLQDALHHSRFEFVQGDICDPQQVQQAMAEVDTVVHFAAESHVDRSINGSDEFIRTNVQGTQVLLDAARARKVALFVQVSTDEVYGSLGPIGHFTEQSPLQPNSPYSASKAAGDLLALAYHQTYNLPVVVTRASNNFGPYQFPEKLIPLFITNLLEGRKVPVYGDGLNVRDWLHVSDHCEALRCVLRRGRPGQVYNIGGGNERNNLQITRIILEQLGCGESCIQYVPDRPGHDRRYAVDCSKIRGELGWKPALDFETAMAQTVEWYCQHRTWWQRIRDGEYRNYYERQYSNV